MPKIRTLRTKKPPKGWDLIEPTLMEMLNMMRDAENEPHEGKRKVESGWKIIKLHHQRSRYIYELYYKKKEISRQLYEYCLREKWADKFLIAKWKKQGYEKLVRTVLTLSSAASAVSRRRTIISRRPVSVESRNRS